MSRKELPPHNDPNYWWNVLAIAVRTKNFSEVLSVIAELRRLGCDKGGAS